MNIKGFQQLWRRLAVNIVCLAATFAGAQTLPDASVPVGAKDSQQKPQSIGQNATPMEDTSPASLVYAPSLDQPGIKELGGSNWFSDNVKILSFGPIAVRSAEILYGYSGASPAASGATGLSAAILQTNLAYSKRLRRSLLVWQYNPRLFYSNGQLSLAAANQDAALNTLFAPIPHLTVGFSEAFTYYGPVNTISDRSIGLSTTDVAVTNPFLNPLVDAQQQTWLNSFSVPITYNSGPKTTIQATPLFNYVHTFGGSNSAAAVADQSGTGLSMLDYGARVQMSHALSPDQTIGFFYLYQRDEQTGVLGNTAFNSFGLSSSRRLGRSWIVTLEGGGSHSSGSESNAWTAVGSVSLAKAFQRGSLEGSFGRDSTFTGLISNDYNNRAAATYNRQAGRRMKWSVGGGYLSGTVLGQQAGGKYATTRVDYTLSSNITWSFSYARLWESGQGTQLVNGGQSQFQIGLRWTPRLRPGM